jgi:hypothetical protein
MGLLSKLKDKLRLLSIIDMRSQKIHEALGRIESRQLSTACIAGVQQNEFQVYSQWGEDGIIQKLIRHIKIEKKIFVEFGVENYTESNTRFLLKNNNWSGLVIDGSPKNIEYIKNDRIYWQHNLKADCSFITTDNINTILKRNGIGGEIGLLSIDIDGNDYWVWEAINSITPAIVIMEYNARFPVDIAVTVPYDAGFVRSQKHHSMVYYGASLKALCVLASKKGYALVGCNSAGNNAFFVKKDLMVDEIKEVTVDEGYVRNQFRESRNLEGELTYLSKEEELKILSSLSLVEIEL